MAEQVYKPGEKPPIAGIYQVMHYRHRLYHDVTILEGPVFPACRSCGERVRFRLVRSAEPVESDRDFRPQPRRRGKSASQR
jgi:hypothetical protein